MADERPRWYGDNGAPAKPVSLVDVNDPTRLIFPADQAAPGSSLAPSSGEVPSFEVIQAQAEAPAQLAALEIAEPVESKYNVPAAPGAERSTAQTSSVTAPTADNWTQAYNTEVGAAKKIGDMEASTYGELSRNDANYKKEVQDAQARQAEYEKKFDEEYGKLRADVDSKKVDSRRWWKDKSTGDKVITMVGMALASLSPSSFQNAMTAIDKTIERDVNDQKADIESGRMRLQDSKTLYAENLRRFGDQRVALATTRMINADELKNRLQSQLSGVKGELAKANGLKMLGQVDQYRQKQQVEIAKIMQENVKEARGLTVPGFDGQAPSLNDAKAFRELTATNESSKAMINRLREINKTSFKSLSPSLRAEAQNIQQLLIGNLRVALTGPGAMNESELELMKSVIANPTSMFNLDSSNEIKLESLIGAMDGKVKSAAKSMGLRPASQSITSFRPN